MKTVLFNIKKNLVLYLAVLLIVPLAVFYFGSLRTKTPNKNKFGLFFACETIKGDEIVESLGTILNEYNITELGLYNDSPVKDEYMFDEVVQTRGMVLSDLMIMPASEATEDFAAFCCKPFKEYSENQLNFADTTYGLKLDKNSFKLLEYELEEDYYIVISKKSYHYQKYISDDNSLLQKVIDWFVK